MPTGQKSYHAEKLWGLVERLVYNADETDLTICHLRVTVEHDLETVVDSHSGVQPGE